jgi:hypothetical protein
MPFAKGQPRPKNAGRKKGSTNKVTASVRAALIEAFDKRGGVGALVTWAKANETEFYKLWGRLVPVEVSGEAGGAVSLTLRVVHE